MNYSHITCLMVASFLLTAEVSGQSFVNLDFEDAVVPPTPVNEWGGDLAPDWGFPGWTVGSEGTLYNSLTLGSAAAILMGPNFPNKPGFTPLQGSYSVLLQYDGYGGQVPPTLSQTGLIPVGTESITLLVASLGTAHSDATYGVVTLNGVNIPLVSIPGGRLAGDISAYAGTVAQLTISGNWLYFDDIQFSPSSVPEPSVYVLAILFLLSVAWRKRSNTTLEPTAGTSTLGTLSQSVACKLSGRGSAYGR